MPARQLRSQLSQKLSGVYDEQEISWFFRYLISDIFTIPFEQTPLRMPDTVIEAQLTTFEQYSNRLATGEPLQYILGSTEFYDIQFDVSPAVLIPRSETEEIVHSIVQHIGVNSWSVLDIGTGSGCIPITIAKNCLNAKVSAFDISQEALAVAERNAGKNSAAVSFFKVDILNWKEEAPQAKFDVIISNPPYILEKERVLMHKNVLDHEPALALFVPNEQPLLFYEAIAEYATSALNPNGWLYFEVNEKYGDETANMLQSKGYANVQIHKDLQGKDRWTVCQLIKQ